MRKIYLIFLLFLSLFLYQKGYAQMRGINFQAVAIDDDVAPIAGVDITGTPLDNRTISVRFTILDASPTGSILYQEVHTTNTDQ
jgi:hypothetical protein